MYFGIAFLLAFCSVFVPNIIGALIDSDFDASEKRTLIITSLVVSILYALFLNVVFFLSATGFYGPTMYIGSIVLGGIIAIIVSSVVNEDLCLAALPGFLVAVVYLLYMFIVVLIFQQSDMMNSDAKAKLIGDVEVINELDQLIEPTDQSQICQVSENMANVKAMNGLSMFKVEGNIIAGSRYEIRGETKQFVDGQFWWVSELGFQSYFKWKQDKQVPGYLRVSALHPLDEAQAVQVNKKGEKIHIKYSLSACFEYEAERYLRRNGYMDKILQDWTFEVDDNWDPYYTVSVVERTAGYSGKIFTKVVVLNMQTGEIQTYDKDKLPDWIDRGAPLDIIDYQVSKWGEYANSDWWYNLWHDDKSQQATPGWYLTSSKDGRSQWFSGFTSSNNSDKALTGIVLADSRTGKTKFVKVKGVTEDIASSTAKSLWSDFKYDPEELVVYNLGGTMTYVIPMTFENQFKGISLVSLSNYDINAKGKTLEEAISNYRTAVAKSKNTGFAPAGSESTEKTIETTITLVGQPIMQGEQQLFLFMVKDLNKIFQASYSFDSPEVPFMKVGSQIRISFQETGEKIITCNRFDILDLVLDDTSINQKLFIQKRAITEKEISRIDQEMHKEDLLRSDRLKKVDPKKLEEFINSQSK
jgi:hypothetical protein